MPLFGAKMAVFLLQTAVFCLISTGFVMVAASLSGYKASAGAGLPLESVCFWWTKGADFPELENARTPRT